MALGWLGRLGILLAIVAPIAAIVLCGLHVFVLWTYDPPCICTINDFLDPPSDNPLEMRIVPPTYLLPGYAVLRAVTFDLGPMDTKTLGVVILTGMFLAPFTLTFFNWSKARLPARFSLLALWPILVGLAWIGLQRPTDQLATISLVLIAAYFALFLIVFPLLARSRP